MATTHRSSTGPLEDHAAGSDGRADRRVRNRRAVVDAMVSLIAEGVLDVTVERAAQRAGVSVRSAYRYFDSVDDLRRQTIDQHFAMIDERLSSLPPSASRRERIEHMVATRLDIFDAQVGPARLARRRAEFVPLVAAHLDRVRARLAEHVRAELAPELEALSPSRRAELISLVDVVTSLDSWDALTRVHRHSRTDVERMLIEAVERMLP